MKIRSQVLKTPLFVLLNISLSPPRHTSPAFRSQRHVRAELHFVCPLPPAIICLSHIFCLTSLSEGICACLDLSCRAIFRRRKYCSSVASRLKSNRLHLILSRFCLDAMVCNIYQQHTLEKIVPGTLQPRERAGRNMIIPQLSHVATFIGKDILRQCVPMQCPGT